VRAGAPVQPAAALLFHEERGHPRLRHLEDQAEVLADQLVVLGDLVPDGAERTAARHPEALLQLDLAKEPSLQVAPGGDVVVEGAAPVTDGLEIGLEALVHEAFLVLEVVIELALPRARSLDDLVRAGRGHSLPVEEVGGRGQDLPPRVVALRGSSRHTVASSLCTRWYR